MATTDNKFKDFLRTRLDAITLDELFEPYTGIHWCASLNLETMATKKLSEHTVAVIKEFCSSLSVEEVQKWMDDFYNLMLFCADAKFLEIIIEYAPCINITNWLSYNVLMCECAVNFESLCVDKIKLFLKYKIDINAKNCFGETALILYCQSISDDADINDIEEILELLIFSGADTFAKSNCDKSAYDYVSNKALLTCRLTQLLQGKSRSNNIKRAIKNDAH